MMKKMILFYLVFSAFFWLLVGGFFFYRVYETRSNNTRESMHGFEKVRQTIEHSYARDKTFDSPAFKGVMREVFEGYPELHILVIYSYDTGIEYLKARNSGNFTSAMPEFGSVRGVPQITYNAFSQTKIGSSITIPQRNSFIVEGVYSVLDETGMFPIFRDSLIALGAFILVTLTVFSLFHVLDRRDARAGRQSQPASAAKADRETARPQPEKPVPEHAPVRPASSAAQPRPSVARTRREDHCMEPDMQKRLTLELERAAFNEQDCSFALIRFGESDLNAEQNSLARQQIISKLAFEDLIFDYSSSIFGVILVNTNLDQGIKLLEDFQRRLDNGLLQSSGMPRCGITSRNGRLVEGNRLVLEAEQALEKSAVGKSTIVGFKPDPGKYRQYVSKTAIR
jgi:hypothetical protein